ncbi:phosphatase PAP2 family protein [Nannocystis sp.]|uniref:phosphatase PAP2 family protein n=1 Tax=Nannocystis sp. TaxID=1962667 RepID=UPI0025F9924C|nr:phosphatase PAP2 family protein [Nannocystis sp.]MBK7830619.1 phosphatase PAP2 family protein [Nannocystis sp.]
MPAVRLALACLWLAAAPAESPAPPVPSASPAPPVPSASPAPPVPSASPAPPVPSASPAPPVPTASPAPPVPSASPAPPVPSASPVPDAATPAPSVPPVHPFRTRLAVDLPIIALTGAIGLATELVGKEQVWAGCGGCDPARINALDRGVLGNHNAAARTYSDIGLYTAIGLPFALDLGDALIQRGRDGSATRGRHMRGWASDAVVLLETFAVNYAATNVVKFAVRRPRPYSYDPDSEVADPTANDARLSFFSGHASTTFAMAAAYASLFQARHPRSRWIAPVWVIGMSLASTTAIARVAAGKHFWTDVITGAVVGSAIGVAIPALHRRRDRGALRHVAVRLAPARTGSLLLVQGQF